MTTNQNIQQMHKNQKEENVSVIQNKIINPEKEEEKDKGTKEKYNISGKTRFKMAIHTYLSIIT